MAIREFVHSRTGAVIAGATVLVTLGGVGGAVAVGQITSSDIRDQTIMRRDIGAGGVASSEIKNNSIRSVDIKDQTIQKRDIGRGAVGSSEVLNGSLRSVDIMNGTLGMRDLNAYTRNLILAPGPASDIFGELADEAATPARVDIQYIGGGVRTRKTDLVSMTLDPGIYLVSAYGHFDRRDVGSVGYAEPTTDTYGALVLWKGSTYTDWNQAAGTYFTGAISQAGRVEATASGSRLLTVTETTKLNVSGFGYNEAQGYFGSADDPSGIQFSVEAMVSAVRVGD